MICAEGHATERPDGRAQLPCGCVLVAASEEALLAEFGHVPSADEITAMVLRWWGERDDEVK